MLLIRLTLTIILAAAPLLSVQAQAPTDTKKRAAIEELIVLIGATQTAKSIFVTLIEQYSYALSKNALDRFENQNWPPAFKEKAKLLSQDFFDRLSRRLREEVPRRIQYEEKVSGFYVEAYDKHFTEDEVRELITFYRSPVGQKFLGLGPRFASDLQKKFEAELGSEAQTVTRTILAEELKQLEERATVQLKATGTKKE